MNTGLKIAAVFIAFLFQITLKSQTMNTKENQATRSIFPKGEKASPEYFTGTAWVKRFWLTTIL